MSEFALEEIEALELKSENKRKAVEGHLLLGLRQLEASEDEEKYWYSYLSQRYWLSLVKISGCTNSSKHC